MSKTAPPILVILQLRWEAPIMALGSLFPRPLFLSVSLFTPLHASLCFSSHCWMPFRFFLCCFCAFCGRCSSPPLSPSSFSPFLFHFFPPLRLCCICLPGSSAIYMPSETLGFDVFGHPSDFHYEGGALDQEAGTGL